MRRCSAKTPFAPAPGSLRAARQGTIEVAAAPVLLAGKDLYYAASVNLYSANARAVVPAGYVGLNPSDAKGVFVANGEKVRLSTVQGSLEGIAQLAETIPTGVVFVPYHCPDLNVQQLLPAGSNLAQVKVIKA